MKRLTKEEIERRSIGTEFLAVMSRHKDTKEEKKFGITLFILNGGLYYTFEHLNRATFTLDEDNRKGTLDALLKYNNKYEFKVYKFKNRKEKNQWLESD